jgi:hypothetical protein
MTQPCWRSCSAENQEMTTIHRISLACILSLVGLTGCAVVAVADVAATVDIGTVGLAADAAIGAVRIAGKGIGAIADAALPRPTP